MRFVNFLSICLIFIFFVVSENYNCRDIKYTTKDPDFVDKYHVTHLKQGNDKSFPRLGDVVKINFKAKNPNTYKLWYTSEKQPPLPVELGTKDSTVCWDLIITRMSKGEKLYCVCKANLVFDGKGNSLIPADNDVGWEIELVGVERKEKKKKKEEI